MRNQWVLKPEQADAGAPRFAVISDEGVGIGAEIESEITGQFGVVVGIIRSKDGVPVCYKVWCRATDEGNGGCFDYIAADRVTLCEPCDSVQWSLERIGYRWIDASGEAGTGYFYNMVTEDVVFW